MRKTLIYMALSIFPLCASADNNKCTPNTTNQDMCIFAKKLADEVQKELPIKNSDDLYLTEVKTDKTRVIITAKMKYSSNELKNTLKIKGNNIDAAKASLRTNAENSVCSNKQLSAFINLGGIMQYEYVFNDGKLLDIVAVTSCK